MVTLMDLKVIKNNKCVTQTLVEKHFIAEVSDICPISPPGALYFGDHRML